jgi:hypothetical protein
MSEKHKQSKTQIRISKIVALKRAFFCSLN